MNRIIPLGALFVVVVLAWFSNAPAAAQSEAQTAARSEVLAVLVAAEAGWNAGDLEAYMASYWRSDDLRFAGGDRVSFGWEQVLAGYRKRYPDQATMGTLTFSDLDVTPLGADAAIAFGRWRLDRDGEDPKEAPTGLFTLLLRRLPEGWRIVHDHTSSR